MSINLTLDRIRDLAEHLPPYTRPTVHIAGTNGKGSVSAFLSSILGTSMSVGRFNSPHLLAVYDSIAINQVTVGPSTYEAARFMVDSVSKEHNLPISDFEILTLTALLIFEQEKVDVVIMEAGMGGRLDATNVIPDACVKVSALTTVDLDHQAFLGSNVAAIAREKAAIARPGKVFVLGHQNHAQVQTIVEDIVTSVGGELRFAVDVHSSKWDEAVDGPTPKQFSLAPAWSAPPPLPIEFRLPILSVPVRARLALHGDHQLGNLGVALSIINVLMSDPSCAELQLKDRLTAEEISSGISAARWPGRLSFHSVQSVMGEIPVLVDGAHNPASFQTLASYIFGLLSSYQSSRRVIVYFVLSLSHSPPKKPLDTLSPLFDLKTALNIETKVSLVPFSPPEGMPWVKCEDMESVDAVIRTLAPGTEVTVVEEPGAKGIRQVLSTIHGDETLVIVAGSLYLVADFYRYMQSKLE